MKKLLTFLVYAVTFSIPALIVQGYSRFVDPMTSSEIKTATLAGTAAMVLMSLITGLGGVKQKLSNRMAKSIKAPSMSELVVKDPGSGAETLFKWNEQSNLWESDHGTYLDQEHMDEWLKQRGSDRKWANEQMKKLKNRDTAFDRDIDSMPKGAGRRKR